MQDTLQTPTPLPDKDARQWAMFCHFAAFLGFILPLGNLIGPLIVWQLKKDSDPFVDAQGKEALNFQICVSLALLVSTLLMVVLIGVLLAGLITLASVVLIIIAGIKANEGQHYRYPFCWRPIS